MLFSLSDIRKTLISHEMHFPFSDIKHFLLKSSVVSSLTFYSLKNNDSKENKISVPRSCCSNGSMKPTIMYCYARRQLGGTLFAWHSSTRLFMYTYGSAKLRLMYTLRSRLIKFHNDKWPPYCFKPKQHGAGQE